MLDSTQRLLDRLVDHPAEQWRFAISRYAPTSGRTQRDRAIVWLSQHYVNATEVDGVVSIGDTIVDRSCVA